MKTVLANLDRGFYKDARAHPEGPRASYGHLTDLLGETGVYPTDAEIESRVKRLLAACGITPTMAENLPLQAQLAAEEYAIDTYGLDKALAEAGIRTKGTRTDKIEKFFATTSSTILFPVYVESQIMLGILATSILPSLIATETNIDAHVYEALTLTDVEDDQQLRIVSEGAQLPTTKITTAERSIRLKKFGRMLEATYESLRLQRINVVSIMLQRIGSRIALDETNEAIQTLIAGDGNTGSAVVDTDALVTGTLDYNELVRLFLSFAQGYQMGTCVVNATNLGTILNMAEFKDPMAGFTFLRTGELPGPFGATWLRWDSTNAAAFSTDRILAIDNRYALEQITEQGIMTESDRLIDKQLERTAITKYTGFAKLDYAATHCLDITT